jgi:hypothetical protein
MKKLIAALGAALILAGCATVGGPEVAESPSATPKPTASVTTKSAEYVTITCSDEKFSNSRDFAVERTDTPPNFAAIWAGDNVNCDTEGEVRASTDIEFDARLIAGTATVDTLYSICASVDPDDTYVNGRHVPSAAQIGEINAVLKLCPEHPHAPQLQATAHRAAVPDGGAEADMANEVVTAFAAAGLPVLEPRDNTAGNCGSRACVQMITTENVTVLSFVDDAAAATYVSTWGPADLHQQGQVVLSYAAARTPEAERPLYEAALATFLGAR